MFKNLYITLKLVLQISISIDNDDYILEGGSYGETNR